jgi:hypothetical protein
MLQDLLLRAPLILCCYQRKLQQNSLFFKSGIRRRPNGQHTNSNNRREERSTLYNISSDFYFILLYFSCEITKRRTPTRKQTGVLQVFGSTSETLTFLDTLRQLMAVNRALSSRTDRHVPVMSEPAPTSAPSTACPLLLSCG